MGLLRYLLGSSFQKARLLNPIHVVIALLFLLFEAIPTRAASNIMSHSTTTSVTGRQASAPWSICGCGTCTKQIWNYIADGPSCGDRITWLMQSLNQSPQQACETVGKKEYAAICGPCFCEEEEVVEEVEDYVATEEINEEQVPVEAEEQEQMQGSSSASSNTATTTTTTTSTDTTTITPPPLCGCDACTLTVWNSDSDGFTCGARIEYLMQAQSNLYPIEQDACKRVGAIEFPSQCGGCACNNNVNSNINAGSNNDGDDGNAGITTFTNGSPQEDQQEQPQQQINANDSTSDEQDVETAPVEQQQQEQPQHHLPPTELYCYPPTSQRTRYESVWGKYTVEVKEDANVCGPSDNLFSTNGVSVNRNNDLVTLEMAKRDGRWHASEVRILLPQLEYYDYGTYSFSIKSIEVVDTSTAKVISETLPPSLIVGLFTWDDTKDYSINEDRNNEVDIELSRWNVNDNADAQFLVQPPGQPQQYRFFTGGSFGSYQQAPHVYQFDWEPASISWYSSAGGGQSFTYSTQMALAAGQPDYTQCMPAQVEVRINLWNLLGSYQAPTDMEDSHVVRVLIDNFGYQPSYGVGVPEGGACSKDCHCAAASPLVMECINNQCTQTATSRSGDTTTTIRSSSLIQHEQQPQQSGGTSSWIRLGAGSTLLIGAIFGVLFLAQKWQASQQLSTYRPVDGVGEETHKAQESIELTTSSGEESQTETTVDDSF